MINSRITAKNLALEKRHYRNRLRTYADHITNAPVQDTIKQEIGQFEELISTKKRKLK